MTLRFLTGDDVRAALPMSDAIDAMRLAFTAAIDGRADIPVRTHLPFGSGAGAMLAMPAALSDPRQLGAKLLTVFPENREAGRPLIHGLVVMFDPDTGCPSGLLEGTALTALRTGAASGLATDLLARRDAARLAVIGSGMQARTQLEAVCCVRQIEHVSVFSPTGAHAARFATEARERLDASCRIEVADSPEEAAEDAAIICTATNATVPWLDAAAVAPGTHINAIGSYKPDMMELSGDLMGRARVVVDQREAALEEAGEIIGAVEEGILDRNGLVELGAVVADLSFGRQSDDEITIFKSVGLAIQDLCAASRALERAEATGIGAVLDA